MLIRVEFEIHQVSFVDVSNVESKSEMVAPKLTSQKEGVLVIVPMPKPLTGAHVQVNSHVQQAHAEIKQSVGKEEDSTNYTSLYEDALECATEEEKIDEAEFKSQEPIKKEGEERANTVEESSSASSVLEGNDSFVQERVQFFENWGKEVCY